MVGVALVSSASFAQSASKPGKAKKVDAAVKVENTAAQSTASSFYTDYMNAKLHKSAVTPVSGDTVLFTDYDYPANTQVRQMVDPFDIDGNGTLDPIAVATARKVGSLTDAEFIYGDGSSYATLPAFDTVANHFNFSSAQVITPKAGPLKGKALVMARQTTALTSYFTKIDLQSFTPSAPVKFGGTAPSFTYANDGTIWANTAGDMKIYKSTDQGATFVAVDSIKHYLGWAYSAPSEVAIEGSSDGKYLSMFGGFAYLKNGNGSATLPLDSTDYIGWLHSEDAGATWKSEKIAYDGYNGQITNRMNNYTWFQNFAQIESAVDDKGVSHAVMNGYGYYDLDSVNSYYAMPVVYWNSSTKKLYAISNQIADEDTNYNPDYRGGNSMGRCYATVSVSADGKVVFAAWQDPEYKGTYGKSELNVYQGDGSTVGGKVYYYNVYGTYSLDGGKTWATPFPIASKANVAECYPNVARRLEVKNGKATAYLVYFEDKLPGQSVFSAAPSSMYNSRTPGQWIYKSYTFNAPTGVEDAAVVANRFDLEQNYPNPFNPTTQITYSLEKSGSVTLKVYNVLGKEVATLVSNKVEAAGKHTVNFNGSDLSSGMYIYTLTSGNTVVSKKMMLLK